MKQYKHKKLWWIARKNRVDWLHLDIWNQTFLIPKELIEESNDRELIEERDWIWDLYSSMIWLFGKQLTEEEEYPMFKERLNKHLPKITEEEIYESTKKDYEYKDITDSFIALLKSKWLLAD